MAIIDAFKFDDNINNELKKVVHYGKEIGENCPVVYLLNDSKEAYIGETHHAAVRMSQHSISIHHINLSVRNSFRLRWKF